MIEDFDVRVKTAIYRYIAATTRVPSAAEVAERVKAQPSDVRQAYARLYGSRVLVLEPDGETIRMAPPFSGVESQHRVRVGARTYYANCSWDALGIPAALHREAEVFSRCEQTLEPLHIQVGRDGPEPEPCVAHFAVPAARWWKDIVYT